MTILKNLDVWESVYDPKHKEMFLESSQITSHKTVSYKNGRNKVFQTFCVYLLLHFMHSLKIFKNLDV